MLVSPDYRVTLADQNSVATKPELEAVFVGLAAEGDPTAAAEACAAAAQLGYGTADDPSLTGCPLAFASAAAFAAAFPADDSWLAHAVTDYFNAGARHGWVVRIDANPAAPLDDFLSLAPPITSDLPQSGAGIAMQVPTAGLLPDLEQLCLESALPPPPMPATDFLAPPPPPVPPLPPGTSPIDPFEVLTRASPPCWRRGPTCCACSPCRSAPIRPNRCRGWCSAPIATCTAPI